jgi:transposase-like protein
VIQGDTKKESLQREVRKRVKPEATVITDELKSYAGLDQHYQHEIINHAEKYVDGMIHTNGLENFWSLLKRSLGGTYVSVRPYHLHRYLGEQAFRYNKREMADGERVQKLVGGIEGKRVTWKELTGKQKPAPKPEPRRISPTRWGRSDALGARRRRRSLDLSSGPVLVTSLSEVAQTASYGGLLWEAEL